MTRPLYIFDLDGTLALIEHRKHWLDSGRKDKWTRFFDDCDRDEPNHPVIRTMDALRATGADVWIFSGRSEEVRRKTVSWLQQHTSFETADLEGSLLTMRPRRDFTPDEMLKRAWYERLAAEDQHRLVAVFDDRDKVVAMWRSLGITCFQVAEGEF